MASRNTVRREKTIAYGGGTESRAHWQTYPQQFGMFRCGVCGRRREHFITLTDGYYSEMVVACGGCGAPNERLSKRIRKNHG